MSLFFRKFATRHFNYATRKFNYATQSLIMPLILPYTGFTGDARSIVRRLNRIYRVHRVYRIHGQSIIPGIPDFPVLTGKAVPLLSGIPRIPLNAGDMPQLCYLNCYYATSRPKLCHFRSDYATQFQKGVKFCHSLC